MIRYFCFFLILAWAADAAAQGEYVTQRRLGTMTTAEQTNNPLALWPLEWGVEPGLPDASLADFSFLLRPPAGRDGATTVTLEGHFASARTGERRRFWGVSLGLDQVDIPTWEIGAFVESLARNGVNLVRFTGLDAPGPRSLAGPRPDGPGGDSQTMHPEVLRRFDYWAASCKEHGIFVAVRLLDQRRFGERDGVAGAADLPAGGGPAALFDPRLIQLQQQFARQLLIEHVNPYLGRPLGHDPALAWIELMAPIDLLAWNWSTLSEPYLSQLRTKWNDWLRTKYKTTDQLFKAWTNSAGESALHSGESLEDISVELPPSPLTVLMRELPPHPDGFTPSKAIRITDEIAFAEAIQQSGASALRDAIRQWGVAAPMAAWGSRFSELGHDGFVAMNVLLHDPAGAGANGMFYNDADWRSKFNQAFVLRGEFYELAEAGGVLALFDRLANFRADGFVMDCRAWPVQPGTDREVWPSPAFWREMGALSAMWQRGGNAMEQAPPAGHASYRGRSLSIWRPAHPDGETVTPALESTTATLRWENAADIEYAAAVALDGRPLDYSRKFYVRGNCFGPNDPSTDDDSTTVALLLGNSISRLPARLMRGEALLLGIGASEGAWEAVFDLDARRVFVRADEPGAAFELGETIRASRECFLDVPSRDVKVINERRVVWPGGALYMEARW